MPVPPARRRLYDPLCRIANALYMTSFVVLFGAFYVANYKAKRKAEKAKQ